MDWTDPRAVGRAGWLITMSREEVLRRKRIAMRGCKRCGRCVAGPRGCRRVECPKYSWAYYEPDPTSNGQDKTETADISTTGGAV
jgi:hypothetical protein